MSSAFLLWLIAIEGIRYKGRFVSAVAVLLIYAVVVFLILKVIFIVLVIKTVVVGTMNDLLSY